ncbi:hypothetical protein BS47DRAFT_1358805 [Hydnum rufescens UP504]|uniref:Uncharacterized protein n=1 Tax=Hydnum rufescens UP504 TaxID=1448309 RepID=A0A9P6E0U0_9AGAM|nr:hypothetical protein BS47DRAFT_1358805 [Hydnum rufescens UP504]
MFRGQALRAWVAAHQNFCWGLICILIRKQWGAKRAAEAALLAPVGLDIPNVTTHPPKWGVGVWGINNEMLVCSVVFHLGVQLVFQSGCSSSGIGVQWTLQSGINNIKCMVPFSLGVHVGVWQWFIWAFSCYFIQAAFLAEFGWYWGALDITI